MCNTCGCNVTPGNRSLIQNEKPKEGLTTISVLQNLLTHNNDQADHNRAHFDAEKVLVINLMSSPGSGKTALLESTIKQLKESLSIAVIEGDLETENDAQRIQAQGVPAYQITTGTACHLDAHLIHNVLHHMPLKGLDLLFIENVGNLVCPASFDLGHHRNVVLLSVTEGDDKPSKYPVMFKAADLVLITKLDLLPYLDDFSIDNAKQNVHNLANKAPTLTVSAKNNLGMDEWISWLKSEIHQHQALLLNHQTQKPKVQQDGALLHAKATPHKFYPVKTHQH